MRFSAIFLAALATLLFSFDGAGARNDPDALRKTQIAALASKAEVEQGLAQLRGQLMQQKLDAEKAAADRQKEFLDRIQQQAKFDAEQRQKLEERLVTKPFWQSSLGVALIAGLISAAVSLGVAELNNRRTTQQKAKDRADDLSSRWMDNREQIKHAFWALEHPPELAKDEQRDKVIWLGDFYDHIAKQWRSGAANPADLASAGFLKLFKKFWEAFDEAEKQGGNVLPLAQNWGDLRAICGRP